MAILSAKTHLRPSTGVSITVDGAFFKETNLKSAQEYSSFHIWGLIRDWIQLATLTAASPIRSSASVLTTVRSSLSNNKSHGDKAKFIFHISGLVCDWIQLATILPP